MNHLSRRSVLAAALSTPLVVPASTSLASSATAATSDPALPNNGDSRYTVSHYQIGDTVLTHPSTNTQLYGATTLSGITNTAVTDMLIDFALPVTSVTINGKTAKATRMTWRQVKITGFSLNAHTPFNMVVGYNGYPNTVNKTAYHNGEEQSGSYIIFSGEPDSSIYWFPSNDRLNDKATYSISVSTQATNQILGYRTSPTYTAFTATNGTKMINTVFDITEPSATYHPGLAVGPFTTTQGTWTIGGVSVPYFIGSQGAIPTALTRDTPRALDYFANLYGPYPYRVSGAVSMNPFPVGAQENIGCCSYGTSLVANTYDAAGAFIAHENAHMWFGDSVTATNWNDVILIHEGLAVLLENDYVQKFGGRSTYSPVLSSSNANYGPSALAQKAPYNSAYYVQRELRKTMDGSYVQANAPKHTAFLKDLAATYSHGYVTRTQFKDLAESHAGKSLAAFWSTYKV